MYMRFAGTAVAFAMGVAVFGPAEVAAQSEEITNKRKSVITRSKVWRPTDIPSLNLKTGAEGPGSFTAGETVTCDYVKKDLGGRTPKFACRLPDGDELKVKYGGTNAEVYGEVAASRLLWALGFGADRMYSVRVVCRGCPDKFNGIRRDKGESLFDPAVVERKLAGRELTDQWGWDELEKIDESAGGATKAERDALKLVAVLLQHSDSKAKQQRIVCLDESDGEGQPCRVPLMMINDVGISFGRPNTFNQQPRVSVNLAEWKELPVWKDGSRCVGNLPGSFTGTLEDPVISEEGRQLLADLLMQLSDAQVRDVFEAARVNLRPRDPRDGRSGFATADEWADAFKQKRREIVERRCAS